MKREDAIYKLKVYRNIFIIIGCIFMCIACYKKNAYNNSEYTLDRNKVNVYVGGDAYNYIINGTYFTAYSVIGMGSFIMATINGVAGVFLSVDREKDKIEEKLPEL